MRPVIDAHFDLDDADLDRIEDAVEAVEATEVEVLDDPQPVIADVNASGVHVETEPSDDDRHLDDGMDVTAELLTALVEAANRRDEDACAELFTADADCTGVSGHGTTPCDALRQLYERRQDLTMTMGRSAQGPAAALWELGTDREWWLIGAATIEVRARRASALHFTDDANVLDEIDAPAPEGAPEGAAWDEWENGVLVDA